MSRSNTLPSFGISGLSCTTLADGMLSAHLVRLFPGSAGAELPIGCGQCGTKMSS